MRLRVIVLFGAAMAAGMGGVMLARGWLEGQQSAIDARLASIRPPEPIQTVPVLVAARDVPGGSFVRVEHLRWAEFPPDAVLPTYIARADPAAEDPLIALEGAVLRHGLVAGEPIVEGRLVRSGERGFLAAVLRPGYRAVSVPINATTGISGFVFPGDQVDVILTHKLPGNETRLASETLLRDIRVLAVDQRTDDQNVEPSVGRTATLEVESRQSEVISVAMEMGTLSLALRSLAMGSQDPDAPAEPEGRSYTWDSQASQLIGRSAGGSDSKPLKQVRVVRASETTLLSFEEGR